ncbi:MAG: hypothetical protein KDC10_00460 [Calditrichaeota bacterium]|nr:hypothetical protein [Candidatus Cloacimonadota bacterium]MCA9788000.1 hypothetical protein [Candidatus Cloacimonadota bacterium]MCB1045642.1 hypothetical protein [Calditrichota bacterium]MCB9474624.1 hypothetical protein [Candidatus Delongbacteria bacterium]
MKRIATLFLAMLMAGTLEAQVIQQVGNGSVDWQVRKVTAVGIAMPSTVGGRAGQIRAARADALRQILETVQGMALTSETTVKDLMLENDVIYTEVRGVCQNFQPVGDPDYKDDGSIELTVEMFLSQEFSNVLVGDMAFASGTPQVTPLSPGAVGGVFTGLIVDCTQISVRPALAPRVLSQSGSEVYGSALIDREWALKNGMVGYVRSVQEAVALQDRIGNNPLKVTAIESKGANGADVVIDDGSGQTLHAMAENLNFLRQCRVVFVVK